MSSSVSEQDLPSVIKARMAALKLTRADVCARIWGLDEQRRPRRSGTLSNLLSGRQRLSARRLAEIAEALGVPATEWEALRAEQAASASAHGVPIKLRGRHPMDRMMLSVGRDSATLRVLLPDVPVDLALRVVEALRPLLG